MILSAGILLAAGNGAERSDRIERGMIRSLHCVVTLVALYAVKCFETEKIGGFVKIRWLLRMK